MFQNDLDVEIVSCFEDCFIMASLTLNSFMFNYVMLGFNGLCFEWVLVDYFGTFQAEMLVYLRWCAHSDLCKLNTIFLKQLSSFQKLLYLVSDVFFACRNVWPNTKIFLCLWHVKIAW